MSHGPGPWWGRQSGPDISHSAALTSLHSAHGPRVTTQPTIPRSRGCAEWSTDSVLSSRRRESLPPWSPPSACGEEGPCLGTPVRVSVPTHRTLGTGRTGTWDAGRFHVLTACPREPLVLGPHPQCPGCGLRSAAAQRQRIWCRPAQGFVERQWVPIPFSRPRPLCSSTIPHFVGDAFALYLACGSFGPH